MSDALKLLSKERESLTDPLHAEIDRLRTDVREYEQLVGIRLLKQGEDTWLHPPVATPEDMMDFVDLHGTVGHILSTLTPREEKVLRMRFGIGEKSDYSLEDVAFDFEVTRERVRQIEAKALRKLRHPSMTKYLWRFHEEGVRYDVGLIEKQEYPVISRAELARQWLRAQGNPKISLRAFNEGTGLEISAKEFCRIKKIVHRNGLTHRKRRA